LEEINSKEKIMKSLITLVFLIGSVMPVNAGQHIHIDQQTIESTAWVDAWSTFAGVKCEQKVFNILSDKIAALVETFNDADAGEGNGENVYRRQVHC
jgi:hypothetical protein